MQQPTASASVVKMARLLNANGYNAVHAALTDFVQATQPMKDALEKYSNAQLPGSHAECVWREMEDLIDTMHDDCSKPGFRGELSKIMHDGLDSRWRDNSEPGYHFYKSLRQMTPAGYTCM